MSRRQASGKSKRMLLALDNYVDKKQSVQAKWCAARARLKAGE